jgi:hypothetical protein
MANVRSIVDRGFGDGRLEKVTSNLNGQIVANQLPLIPAANCHMSQCSFHSLARVPGWYPHGARTIGVRRCFDGYDQTYELEARHLWRVQPSRLLGAVSCIVQQLAA